MGENFKESTKLSFQKAKKHNLKLEKAIFENREFLIEQNKEILQLKEKIKLLISDLEDLKEEISICEVSSGNEGVINNHQQSSSTINNNQQQSTMIIKSQ